jgi:hypothetical protein
MHIVHVRGKLVINKKDRGKLVKSSIWVNMLRLSLMMHHIALCTPCIALFIVPHICAFCDRPHEDGTRGANRASSSRRLH